MTLGWGAIGVVYLLSALISRQAYELPYLRIDTAFGFVPEAFWLYMSFFLFIPLCWFCCTDKNSSRLKRAMIISAAIAGVVFMAFPTTMAYPEVDIYSAHGKLIGILRWVDTSGNCLPSLHAALTFVSAAAIFDRAKVMRTAFFSVWGVGILLSILFLKRHLFIDLATGLVLGIVCWYTAVKTVKSHY